MDGSWMDGNWEDSIWVDGSWERCQVLVPLAQTSPGNDYPAGFNDGFAAGLEQGLKLGRQELQQAPGKKAILSLGRFVGRGKGFRV